jgi:hypothetical protein
LIDQPTTELNGEMLEQMPLPRVKAAARSSASLLLNNNSPLLADTGTAKRSQ